MAEQLHTTEVWLLFIGEQCRQQRLRANLSQEDLTRRAGISLSALKNLEGGKGATISTLIKAARALGRTDWLSALQPPVQVNPLDALKRRPGRQRVSKYRRTTGAK